MKYRIKIITYKSGSKKYWAQFKSNVCWVDITYEGGLDYTYCANSCSDREDALKRIDKHHSGNTKKQFIEFEYIIK